MIVFEKIRCFERRVVLFTTLAVSTGGVLNLAHAQSSDNLSEEAAAAATPPYALLQYSTLTGTGNTITATWIPVVTASGTTYKNVTLLFEVDSSENLTVAPGYPQVVKARTPLVSAFRAGKYVGPSTIYSGQMIVNVAGQGILPGGATEWSLAAASGATGCTYPDTANWYVTPVANSPLAARLKAAGITSNAWSYGIGGSECATSTNSDAWQPHSLLGFSQVGKTLTIASFTDYYGKDYSTPRSQITYTLTP